MSSRYGRHHIVLGSFFSVDQLGICSFGLTQDFSTATGPSRDIPMGFLTPGDNLAGFQQWNDHFSHSSGVNREIWRLFVAAQRGGPRNIAQRRPPCKVMARGKRMSRQTTSPIEDRIETSPIFWIDVLQWIGSRENPQETLDFPPDTCVFPVICSLLRVGFVPMMCIHSRYGCIWGIFRKQLHHPLIVEYTIPKKWVPERIYTQPSFCLYLS